MAASIESGINWADGDTVHAQRLADSIENAAITGADRENKDPAEVRFFGYSDKRFPASPALLEPFYNTLTGVYMSRISGGPNFAIGLWPTGRQIRLSAASATALAGSVLGIRSYDGTTWVMQLAEEATGWNSMAIGALDMNPGAFGIATFDGMCRVKMKDSVTALAGERLFVSDEDGLADRYAKGSGHGPLTFATAYRNTNDGYTWSLLKKV